MIAIGDSSVNEYWDAFIDPEPEKDPQVEWPEYPSDRHLEGMTSLMFCDGHVESLVRDSIVSIENQDRMYIWNNDGDNDVHIP